VISLMNNLIVEQKRNDLLTFIRRELFEKPAVRAVIAIGSVATGLARPDSGIDAVIFLEPFDLYATPAEFQWTPQDGAFHGIFVGRAGAIQFDFKRLDLAAWSRPHHVWPEPLLAELAEGWVAFDWDDAVQPLLAERTAYPGELQLERLDEALTQLDQLLQADTLEQAWTTLGPKHAHDWLHTAYVYLVQALFAPNGRWQPWRSREMSYLLGLPWLADDFADEALVALNAPTLDIEGYRLRAALLARHFRTLIDKLVQDNLYRDDLIGEAFIRRHDEPGRNWNIAERVRRHEQRQPSSWCKTPATAHNRHGLVQVGSSRRCGVA
jgi:hypothetical protein